MRVCLTGVQRHALYGWMEGIGPDAGWKETAGELATAATWALGFTVTRDHIVTARRALLPKPPTEPTVEARVDAHDVALLTLEAQVKTLAELVARHAEDVKLLARALELVTAQRPGASHEPDPELSRPLAYMDPDVPTYGGVEDPSGDLAVHGEVGP